jgi:hypothetical protein
MSEAIGRQVIEFWFGLLPGRGFHRRTAAVACRPLVSSNTAGTGDRRHKIILWA